MQVFCCVFLIKTQVCLAGFFSPPEKVTFKGLDYVIWNRKVVRQVTSAGLDSGTLATSL